jgi:hypothetical protein
MPLFQKAEWDSFNTFDNFDPLQISFRKDGNTEGTWVQFYTNA